MNKKAIVIGAVVGAGALLAWQMMKPKETAAKILAKATAKATAEAAQVIIANPEQASVIAAVNPAIMPLIIAAVAVQSSTIAQQIVQQPAVQIAVGSNGTILAPGDSAIVNGQLITVPDSSGLVIVGTGGQLIPVSAPPTLTPAPTSPSLPAPTPLPLATALSPTILRPRDSIIVDGQLLTVGTGGIVYIASPSPYTAAQADADTKAGYQGRSPAYRDYKDGVPGWSIPQPWGSPPAFYADSLFTGTLPSGVTALPAADPVYEQYLELVRTTGYSYSYEQWLYAIESFYAMGDGGAG